MVSKEAIKVAKEKEQKETEEFLNILDEGRMLCHKEVCPRCACIKVDIKRSLFRRKKRVRCKRCNLTYIMIKRMDLDIEWSIFNYWTYQRIYPDKSKKECGYW